MVDGSRARIILAALVTPAAIQNQAPMLDLERWNRLRWAVQPVLAVADKKYGTLDNMLGLAHDGTKAYLGLPDHRHRNKYYSDEDFYYDAQLDHYLCPADEVLPRSSYNRQRDVYMSAPQQRSVRLVP